MCYAARGFVKRVQPPLSSISEYSFFGPWFISIFSDPNRAILVGFDTTNNDSPLFPSKYLYRLNLPFFVGNPLFYFPESSTTPLQLLTPVTEEFLPYMLIYNGKFLPYNDLIQLESILDQPKDKLDDVFIPSSIIIRNH